MINIIILLKVQFHHLIIYHSAEPIYERKRGRKYDGKITKQCSPCHFWFQFVIIFSDITDMFYVNY